MEIYLVIFTTISIFALVEHQKIDFRKNSRGRYFRFNPWNIHLAIFAVVIIVLAGIRWEIGTDWDSFIMDYSYLGNASWEEIKTSIYGLTYGKGYVLLTHFFGKYVGNYSVYLTFQAMIIILCTYPIIYKYSSYPSIAFLGLFSYAFGYAFAVPRSGISIAMCYLAFDSILEKKNIRALIYIVVATMFHNVAIFFVFAFLLYRIKLDKSKILIIGIGSLVLSKCLSKLLFLVAALPFVPISYSMRIYVYLTNNVDYGTVNEMVRVITRGVVLILIIFFLWKRRDDKKINFMINLYLFSISIYILTADVSEVFIRAAYYFEDISQFIIFSECVASAKARSTNLFLKILLILFFAIKLLSRLLIGNKLLVPYKTIFG